MPNCISKLDNTLVYWPTGWGRDCGHVSLLAATMAAPIPPECCHGQILWAWAGSTDGDSPGPCPPASYTVLLQRTVSALGSKVQSPQSLQMKNPASVTRKLSCWISSFTEIWIFPSKKKKNKKKVLFTVCLIDFFFWTLKKQDGR